MDWGGVASKGRWASAMKAQDCIVVVHIQQGVYSDSRGVGSKSMGLMSSEARRANPRGVKSSTIFISRFSAYAVSVGFLMLRELIS